MRRSTLRGLLVRAAAAGSILAILSLTATPVESQVTPAPGDTTRVRPFRYGAAWQEGIVVGADSLALRFVRSGTRDTVTVPLARVKDWEIARGSSTHPVRGLLIGLGLGAAAGALAVPPLANGAGWGYGTEDVLIGAGIGGAFGAGVGVLIGALTRTEKWHPVVRPAAGIQTGVSVAF